MNLILIIMNHCCMDKAHRMSHFSCQHVRLFFCCFLSAILPFTSVFAQAEVKADKPYTQKVSIQKVASGHLHAEMYIQQKFLCKMMIESGIPFLILDSTFVFNNLEELGFELTPQKGSMNLNGNKVFFYYVTHTDVCIDSQVYKGKTLIGNLAHKHIDAMCPVQHLVNEEDSCSRLVELNIRKNYMAFLTRKELKEKCAKYDEFVLNTDGYMDMYALQTSFDLYEGNRTYSFSGNYLIDLGNASFLIFMEQGRACKELVNTPGLELKQACNKSGKPIPMRGFIAKKCKLAGRLFMNETIATTGLLTRMDYDGSLGLKFFEHYTVILDFENRKLYLKR